MFAVLGFCCRIWRNQPPDFLPTASSIVVRNMLAMLIALDNFFIVLV
ncbi:hypothetical protein H5123_08180 [Shewanella sp. SR43-4]|nr:MULTISPECIES: hypothetical protein [Shewanella]MBB1317615.1 hypothetical protein [Shewanella sp. SR43-4]UJL41808.1 hypothetical protein KDH10_002838 [Shewanella vesiculosa]